MERVFSSGLSDSQSQKSSCYPTGFQTRNRDTLGWWFLVNFIVQTVKDLSTMQETGVQSLGWEDPLEKGMATHSSILAWKNPMDREAWRATIWNNFRLNKKVAKQCKEVLCPLHPACPNVNVFYPSHNDYNQETEISSKNITQTLPTVPLMSLSYPGWIWSSIWYCT